MNLTLAQATANVDVKCSICSHVILAREIFWKINEVAESSFPLIFCTNYVPLNCRGFDSTTDVGITYLTSKALDIRGQIIPKLLADWSASYDLSHEEFEELVFDRILEMGHQGVRIGQANRPDGGIDVIFWALGSIPTLWAVQVKHHHSPHERTGVGDIRDFAGAISRDGFNGGMVVTNTSFTEDAKWFAENKGPLLQLRNGEHLKKWIEGDFTPLEWNSTTRTIELRPGLPVTVPHFL